MGSNISSGQYETFSGKPGKSGGGGGCQGILSADGKGGMGLPRAYDHTPDGLGHTGIRDDARDLSAADGRGGI